MKHIARLCRLVVGLVFILSGFLKLLAPVGTSLIIKEYLIAFHLPFLSDAALVLGIALSVVEFMTGVALLLRLRFRLMAWVALVLVGFFTPLTLYLALFNPISDCGCFGEAVHLTNWQTFFKNLILLPNVLVMFIWQKTIARDTHPLAEWIFMLLFALLATAILLQTMLWEPMVEFTDYRVGHEIKQAPANIGEELYDTVFIYEKDGDRRTFTIDNLPDSTWTFVDATTVARGGGISATEADFMIEDSEGNDVTSYLLSRRRLLLMTIYHPDKFVGRYTTSPIESIAETARAQGLDFMLVSSSNIDELGQACPDNRADLKLLMTLNRSNGGVTLLDDGLIVSKWAFYRAMRSDADFCANEDPEMTVLKTVNRQRHSIQVVIGLFLLLCVAKFIVFRRLKR